MKQFIGGFQMIPETKVGQPKRTGSKESKNWNTYYLLDYWNSLFKVINLIKVLTIFSIIP
jgi:hypothetical protein